MRYVVNLFVFVFVFASCKPKTTTTEPEYIVNADSLRGLDSINYQLQYGPNNPDLYYKRAQYYLKDGKFDKGLIDIKRAIEIDSLYPDYYILLADYNIAYLDADEADKNIRKAIALAPKNPNFKVKMGELGLYQRNFKKMFNYLDSALYIDPYIAKVYFLKGLGFLSMNDTNLAISSFQTATEQNPDYFEAYLQLAHIFSEKDNPTAIELYKTAIQLDETSVEARYGLAYYLQEHNDVETALNMYKDLTVKVSDYAPAYHNIGYIYLFYKQDPKSAIPWFTKAIQADIEMRNAYYHRGYAYEKVGDNGSALLDYQKAARIDPDFDLAIQRIQKIRK